MTTLWIVVVFIVLFAANIILGHNLIPSFVESDHIPRIWQKARVLFYGAALASFVVAMFFLAQVIKVTANVLGNFWPDYWV